MLIACKLNFFDLIIKGMKFYNVDYFNEIEVGSHTLVLFEAFNDPCLYYGVPIIYAGIKIYRSYTQILKQIKEKGIYIFIVSQMYRTIITIFKIALSGFVYVIVYNLLKLFS